MKNVFRNFLIAVSVLCGSAAAQGNPYSLTVYTPQVITTTSFTTPAIPMGPSPVVPGLGASQASCFVEVIGSSLTTATFGVTASYDPSGTLYVPVASLASVATPGTTATTATATANGVYQFKCGGMFSVKFVTSGTFTATSISLQMIASPNAQLSAAAGASHLCASGNDYACLDFANIFSVAQTIAPPAGLALTIKNSGASYGQMYVQFAPDNAPGGDHKWNVGFQPPGCGTLNDGYFAICLDAGVKMIVLPNDGTAVQFPSSATTPWLDASAAATTAASGHIRYGGTTAVSSNCGSLALAVACILVNVAGVAHYIPYY